MVESRKSQREIELEEIESTPVLKWVAMQNENTQCALETQPCFEKIKKKYIKYLDQEKIPSIAFNAEYLYNFSDNGDCIRGLWRRTTLIEYRNEDTEWEDIFNLDDLPELQKWNSLRKINTDFENNWLCKLFSIAPNGCRALVSLTENNQDAFVVRELNLKTKTFVKYGFEFSEGKSHIDWHDSNSVWVSHADLCNNSLTQSGYPRVLNLLYRGHPLNEAKKIYEIDQNDIMVYATTTIRAEATYHILTHVINFYETKKFIINNSDLSLTFIPIPDTAEIAGFFNNNVIVTLRNEWKVMNGPNYKAGSVISLNLDSIKDINHLDTSLIFQSTATVVVDKVHISQNYLILILLNNVYSEVHRVQLKDNKWFFSCLPFPKLGTIELISIKEKADQCILKFESFLTPSSLYYYNASLNTLELLKSSSACFDAALFSVNQYTTKSKDGTCIPYFIVYPKSMKYDGKNPTLLHGYGGFETSLTPYYLGVMGKVWLKKGGVYVLANTRGGGEFGPEWHQAGIKENRYKVFEDFIAIAEDLIAKNITSNSYLGISGASNGGLLVGAAFTMRPDLFKAVVCEQPLLDMLNYHKMLQGASWIGEFGDPRDSEMNKILKSYSPYHNVFDNQSYPKILFISSTQDDRVHPAHARKMVDKMQSMGHEVYYYEDCEGGHGSGVNGVYIQSLTYTYLINLLIEENKPKLDLVQSENKSHLTQDRFFSQPIKKSTTQDDNKTLSSTKPSPL